MKTLSFIIICFLSLGCVANEKNSSIIMEMKADPPLILENGVSFVHVDITNADTKPLRNVNVYVFNPGGRLSYNAAECKEKGNFGLLKAGEFRTFSCPFKSGKINQDRISTEINALASFSTEFSAVQQLEVISEDEYQNRLATSTFRQEPQVYIYNDRNIQLQVEFTEPPPIVIKNEREVYVKFTIRNIGTGFIKPISPSDIKIVKQSYNPDVEEPAEMLAGSNGGYCRPENILYPTGNEFPSFSCKVLMKSNSAPMSSKGFLIKINYSYEIRDSVRIDITR